MAIQYGIVEKMKSEFGKLFIGGISWDTDEDRLKEYFGSYGEVVETLIMRDRLTGRARGFGFVVFADPVVAERVVMEKHMIDGRAVEAKKAVPRDGHHGPNINNGSIQRSPGPVGRTKKIFVGGLASSVTESDFKEYFDQFGGITDVVVMYDHSTHRPRGFGFITYDSEEAVDMVLRKTFHELNGKMVEVKRAVPKELSAGPSRSPSIGYSYGLGRPNTSLTDGCPQGYGMSSIGGHGVRVDSRFSPVAGSRTAFSPFSSVGYEMGMNLEPILSPGAFGGTSNLSNNMGYGQVLSPYYGGSPNRNGTPIGYNRGSGRSELVMGASSQSVWGNGGSGTYLESGSGGFGVFGASWCSSFSHNSGNIGENSYVVGGGNNGRSLFNVASGSFSMSAWQSSYNEVDVDGSASFVYGLHDDDDDEEKVLGITSSEGYVGNYGIANRQPNRAESLLGFFRLCYISCFDS